MFEFIGEQIRTQVFDSFAWITRAGGLTEMLEVSDNGTAVRFPASKPVAGQPCEQGDYINLSPHGREVCIAFVDAPGDINTTERNGMWTRVDIPFRVVVWYNEDKIDYTGNLDKAARMTQDIITAVKAATFSGAGVYKAKGVYTGLSTNPERIWGKYGFKSSDGLFMLPYRTFAINFSMKAFVTNCAEVDSLSKSREVC